MTGTDLRNALQEPKDDVYITHHPGCDRCEKTKMREPEPCMALAGKKCTRCIHARQACSLAPCEYSPFSPAHFCA